MGSGDDQATVGFAVPPALAAITARYELLAEVGRGGMGVVYKARDRQTGDLIAVKVIHPSVASDSVLVDRFRNELVLARRITHKNVCRVFDLNEFGGTTVISMELVDGRSLRGVLRDVESLSTRQGLKIVRQIAAGLAEAHARGVVHRDLKPENILIGPDGAVKIMDFGIARLIDSRVTATGHIIGTPAYMSPEQAEGRPADARSDIYSLGLVMYEMFCGRPAFVGETPIALVAKHVGETPLPPRAIEADLPVRIDAAIRTCLEKNPARRFQSVAELEAALSSGSGAGGDAPEHGGAQLPEHLTRWQRSDWLLVGAAAIGMIVFVSLFARVSLTPRSQVTFDRAVLRRIGEEHLQRLGVPGGGEAGGGQPERRIRSVQNVRRRGGPRPREQSRPLLDVGRRVRPRVARRRAPRTPGQLCARQATPIDSAPGRSTMRSGWRDKRSRTCSARAEARRWSSSGKRGAGLQLPRERRGPRQGSGSAEQRRRRRAWACRCWARLRSSAGLRDRVVPVGEVTMNEWGLPMPSRIPSSGARSAS